MAAKKEAAGKKAAPAGKKGGGVRKAPEPRPRVVAWLEELSKAGESMEKAGALFKRVKTDVNANRADKEHFYRTLAQQSLIWYMGAIRGKPLTGEEIKQAAQESLQAANAATARKSK